MEDRVPFSDVCQLLQQLSNSEDEQHPSSKKRRQPPAMRRMVREKRKSALLNFFSKWRSQASSNAEKSLFEVVRLLLPNSDRARPAYGLKEVRLAELIIRALQLSPKGEAAESLKNWKHTCHTAQQRSVDFGAAVDVVLRERIGASTKQASPLMLGEVSHHLDKIAEAAGGGGTSSKEHDFTALLRRMNSVEMKWLCRIILKSIDCTLSDADVMQAIHPRAAELFNVTTSLDVVCRRLYDPSVDCGDIRPEQGYPYRPMLAARCRLDTILTVMKNKPFYIEVKYDGERVQLHKNGEKYRYFSRNGLEYTEKYGAAGSDKTRRGGSLTPFIHACFAQDVSSCILDGELVGWYRDADCVATKSHGEFDVKKLKRDHPGIQPCYVVFDILSVNGRDLTKTPLCDRLTQLQRLFTPLRGRLMLSQSPLDDSSTGGPARISTNEELLQSLQNAIERREEGLLVKRPDSIYGFNVRSKDAGWVKLKPDYIEGLMDSLDLLVVGASFGKSQEFAYYLLAVACRPDDAAVSFKTVCAVGSGVSNPELREVARRLAKHATPFRRDAVPPWLKLGSDKPDVIIDYRNSAVFCVNSAEIVPGHGSYATQHTLRFPRILQHRDDKDHSSCMTEKELEDLRQETAGRLVRRGAVERLDMKAPSATKRRKVERSTRPTLDEKHRLADVSKVEKQSDAFTGREVCVMDGDAECSKAVLEKGVVALGGSITLHPNVKTFCVVSTKYSLRLKSLSNHDILKLSWLKKCIEQHRLVEWEPADFWCCSRNTKEVMAKDYDRYGDSYIRDTDADALKTLFNGISAVEEDVILDEEIRQRLISREDLPLSNVKLFIDETELPDMKELFECISVRARQHGAELVTCKESASHVIGSDIESAVRFQALVDHCT